MVAARKPLSLPCNVVLIFPVAIPIPVIPCDALSPVMNYDIVITHERNYLVGLSLLLHALGWASRVLIASVFTATA